MRIPIICVISQPRHSGNRELDEGSKMAVKNVYYHRENKVNYPQEHWWVVGTSDEFKSDAIVSRRILDIPVALFRAPDKTIVALEDACPHRSAPLSVGTIQGDNIICGYHGMQFAPDGNCVNIPTQSDIPRSCRVRAFTVVEKPPFVWIWTGLGEPTSIDNVPEYFWLNSSDWAFATDYIHLNCNYMMLKENVIDLTHFAFVHATSFEMGDDYGEPPECIVEDGTVAFRQEFMDKPLPGFWDQGIGLGNKRVDRVDMGTSMSPAEHIYTQEVENKNPIGEQRAHYSFRFQHMTTPETPTSHHYWWVMARDHGLGEASEKWMKETVSIGFQEDKVLLELIQQRLDSNQFPKDAIEMSVRSDQPSLQTRFQAERLIKAEAAQQLTETPQRSAG